MKIYSSITDLIGNTPLLKISNYSEKFANGGTILAKLELFNPAGSIKDRVARNMIADAERAGKLVPGATIIEPTSGNTGIGLAAIASAKGYKAIIVMPDSMSVERRTLMSAYGAKLVLTPGAEGMSGAIKKAEELASQIPGSIVAGQFVNPANPTAHYSTTAPEIWEDTDGDVDIVVVGVGTGGTITGIGRYLKEKRSDIKIIAVEPSESPVLSGGKAGPHGLQGIGAGFVPEILDMDVIDDIVTVKTEEAYGAVRNLAKSEGVLVGISSGAALYAATELAKKTENSSKKIVVILPDTGDRYLSTPMFAE